ncbi:tumor protein p53-inducible protein 13 [Hyperolius riggenbachi]|uniref:tumor protein p53-inducible protein 13 n=1 Tax=Hyperolius riggenbachi TaxID=752182 RepID=UPI0035A32D0B
MWRLCALCALLVSPARGCDNGQFNIGLDLPDESAYLCPGKYIPPPTQVSSSVATKYEQENTYHACMDTAINYTAPIPNSGAHRPIPAEYGEYVYCPPQRWLHNLLHAGVAFLYHPCVDPQLKDALSYVARSCFPRHIITPLPSLSRDRPIALATWCSTLEMSHINVTELWHWLRENLSPEHHYERQDHPTYQHLLIRPSTMSPDLRLCQESILQMVDHSLIHGGRSLWHLLKKRRRKALPVSPSTKVVASARAHTNISSSPFPGHAIYTTTKNHPVTTQANGLPSPPMSFTSATTVSASQPLDPDDVKASIHSRETEANNKVHGAELPVHKIIPAPENTSPIMPDLNGTQFITRNITKETEEGTKEQLPQTGVTQKYNTTALLLEKVAVNIVTTPTANLQAKHQEIVQELSPPGPETLATGGVGQKTQECVCQHDATAQASGQAQQRLSAGQQKSSDVFISTPRTQEATWAAASVLFLFSLLTFAVLYTQIYKKFRKSQSLYWASGTHSEEKETVASIIKRRLVQGHSKRKKWFGKKKSPTVVYESLSDSSD